MKQAPDEGGHFSHNAAISQSNIQLMDVCKGMDGQMVGLMDDQIDGQKENRDVQKIEISCFSYDSSFCYFLIKPAQLQANPRCIFALVAVVFIYCGKPFSQLPQFSQPSNFEVKQRLNTLCSPGGGCERFDLPALLPSLLTGDNFLNWVRRLEDGVIATAAADSSDYTGDLVSNSIPYGNSEGTRYLIDSDTR